MSAIIGDVRARKVFNSRGNPTIEVDVTTITGFGSASAPNGASTGKAEAVPFPKGGIEEALRKVEELIKPKIIGCSADEQENIDKLLNQLDGTDDFKIIGGNTAYSVSLAVAEAAASSYDLPLYQYLGGSLATCLPFPLGNVVGGGKHALGKATDIQEFLVLPLGAPSFLAAVKANSTIHKKLKVTLGKIDSGFTGGKGDEGAWAPNITNEQAIGAVFTACKETSKDLGFECRPGLDIAASSLWNESEEAYFYTREGLTFDRREQIEYILGLIEKYNLIYVEDPLHEDDFEGFEELTRKSSGCIICGDDLFVTNVKRLNHGIKQGSGNGIIIKMNQVGTLTETWKATRLAKEHSYVPVVSHRSGETVASHLSHLAVGFGAPIIKTGVVGGERIAKLNELIRIEEALGSKAEMARLKI